MSNRMIQRLLCTALLSLPLVVQADDAPPNYLGGMFSFKLPDNDTGTDQGYGGHVLYGSPMNQWLSLELNGFGHALLAAPGFVGETDAYGAGLDLRGNFLNTSIVQLFGIGGVGAAYLDNANTGEKSVAPFLNVGTGAVLAITEHLSLRAEARYYLTAASNLGLGANLLNDGHFNFGLQYSFAGQVPQEPVMPPPPPAPVQVVPPSDQDQDGVLDGADACPNTPAGAAVDAKGCPLPPPDADGDGVTDAQDVCPHTAAGLRVDAQGCVVRQVLVLHNLIFSTAKNELSAGSKALLDAMAESLKEQPNLTIGISGHTDSVGSQQANLKLSKARAEQVKDYLVSKGIAAERLTAEGFGEFKPIVENNNADNRALNRRVEFDIKQ